MNDERTREPRPGRRLRADQHKETPDASRELPPRDGRGPPSVGDHQKTCGRGTTPTESGTVNDFRRSGTGGRGIPIWRNNQSDLARRDRSLRAAPRPSHTRPADLPDRQRASDASTPAAVDRRHRPRPEPPKSATRKCVSLLARVPPRRKQNARPANRNSDGMFNFDRPRKRFKSVRHAQRFLSAFSAISAHFRPRRHRLSATQWRTEIDERFAVWREVTALDAAA